MASCFLEKQQSKKSPVDDTMNRWSPYEKYAGRNNEIILGPYRTINKLNPEYIPSKKETGDIGALQLIIRNKKTTTEEKYYISQCINETDTAFMYYSLKYTFTEDKPALISNSKTRKTNIIKESTVISGRISTTLNDKIWHFRIGPYAIELRSKSDSSYYQNVSGYLARQGDLEIIDTSTAVKKSKLNKFEDPGAQQLLPVYNTSRYDKSFDVIPARNYHSPLFSGSDKNPAGLSFLESSRCIAILTFSGNVEVLIKKNATAEYRLVIAAICSAMYDLKGGN